MIQPNQAPFIHQIPRYPQDSYCGDKRDLRLRRCFGWPSTGLKEKETNSSEILESRYRRTVLEQLKEAREALVAVAFFNPEQQMLDQLLRVPKLKLIVSEEFAFNNPYKLEKLKRGALRSIPPDSEHGKLHAKVIIVRRRDGSRWVLLGSANLTRQGMFKNQEACTVIESNDSADVKNVQEIETWFDALFEQSRDPDLERAKLIFDAQSHYRRVPRPSKNTIAVEPGYWALKATSGSTGEQHWPMFLAEQVVAVGWEDLAVDPSKVSDALLRAAIKATYQGSARSVDFAAAAIKKFVSLEIDDIVLLCRGYTSTQRCVWQAGLAHFRMPKSRGKMFTFTASRESQVPFERSDLKKGNGGSSIVPSFKSSTLIFRKISSRPH